MSGEPAFCLLDFFGDDFTLVIDESHVTLPQLHGMYKGDYSRKKSLIDYGFRLPSAFDNRPLKFEEFEKRIKNTIFVSATPADYERHKSSQIVEQLVRPTGLIDPEVEIRNSKGQMDDLIIEITKCVKQDQRILITTLTKRMAEDLAEYLSKKEIRVRYLHSEIQGLQRTELIRQLRLGEFDVLVGINLLREGLDIPEVSLVAILDADKEGFLRNKTSLIQTFGRAARNSEGRVIMYADNTTVSMKSALLETKRRREKQIQYNKTNKIIPKTIIKSIPEQETELDEIKNKSKTDLKKQKIEIEIKMKTFAEDLDFENAIQCRDKIKRIQMELDKDESK
jgi:excinuclease ABC subunit B